MTIIQICSHKGELYGVTTGGDVVVWKRERVVVERGKQAPDTYQYQWVILEGDN